MRTTLCSLIFLMSLAPSGFTDEPNKPQVPLFDGLGERSRKIQTKNPKAQRYFDQGVMFIADFNHDEAVRSFREAARLDPECAMAYWGIALARSTNINHPDFTPAKAKVIAEAVAKAREKANGEKDANRALIEALAVRYPAPAPKERADAEKAYSRAMKAVWEKFPKDADVGTLYAESLMNLRPYDYWKEDGKPQPWTPEILGTLDTVRILDPTHPLANHLYIHAVDWSPESGKAIAAADALRGKYPALGHLVHMPSHIDVIHGRWQQAIDANRLALAADCKYRKAVPEQGIYRMYMAHNFHMLTFAATMQGQSDLALKTMREMIVELFPKEVVAVKENVVLADGLMAMPLEVLKRFGRWDDVLKEPEPPEIFPFTRAMRHYNRGVAFAAKAQVDKAREAQRSFRAAVKLVPEGAQFTLHFNKAADLLAIADHMLEGEILFREGKRKEAIAALETAVAREDRLLPDDPPDWFIPARHTLGATLLKSKQAEAAQKVYREDLRRWPNNGWSLHGLAQTLQALNKKEEAAKVKERFKEAWKRADLEIPSSCFCVEGR